MPDILPAQTEEADSLIQQCLQTESPKSFFLYAGAGSGKTRSLVNALKFLKEKRRDQLRVRGQKIAVITYTNKACDEIKERMEYDYLIEVKTIHSFVWSLIEGYNADIKKWVAVDLKKDLQQLEADQAKGRTGTKVYADRARQILSKTARLQDLDKITKFTYNPNGENLERDSLNHSEVLQIGASFLTEKAAMQSILVNRYPVLLIDESQDTNKGLIEAFFVVESRHSGVFSLGLFGDMMQRIYADGKADLGQNIPATWSKPAKKINYRCPKRIVDFINKMRHEADRHVQEPATAAIDGHLHFFIFPNTTPNRAEAERTARAAMAAKTGDEAWINPVKGAVKTLILEHHMAAARMQFAAMYDPLYANDRLKIGLLAGNLSGLRLFSDYVLPLREAFLAGDKFEIARLVRENSPLLERKYLKSKGQEQLACVHSARDAVAQLMALWDQNPSPSFLDVLKVIAETNLFRIPESLLAIAKRSAGEATLPDDEAETAKDNALKAWDEFLATPFAQIKSYVAYVSGEASFDTHQGVKGLEFERVMVIIDDHSAKGFMFNFEKLFGASELTPTDLRNQQEGKDTGVDRTRRLLYVTSSRAEKSLAIVIFSENPAQIKNYITSRNWCSADEITAG